MPHNAYIFECSTTTYLDCIQKGLFASNLPWPLQIKKGDYCCLHHYEVGTLLALWQAASDGGRSLAPRAWRGRFPFQVKVSPVTPEIIEIPKETIPECLVNADTGKFDNILDTARAQELLSLISNSARGAARP
jgi:hypothetical protein